MTTSQPKDMRSWIATLKEAGELVRIDKPVDPLTQMGSLLYQSREKALLFENLPHGWRSLGQAPANVRHAALAFGTTEDELVPMVARRMGTLVPPVMVNDAPVKDRIFKRGEFDLTHLPVHVAGRQDAGPVIGSGLVVSKDPDTGQRNVSFHRLQIKGRTSPASCFTRAIAGRTTRSTRRATSRCRWPSSSATTRSTTPPRQPPPHTASTSSKSPAAISGKRCVW